jgi:hypothetical protein
MPPVQWIFGPTINAYIHSTAQIVALFGKPGTHKTFASIQALLNFGRRCGQRIRGFIVRDTLKNISISLVPAFHEFFRNAPGAIKFSDEDRKLIINIDYGFELDLFGVNDPADMQRLQGASAWSFGWINDPAPMVERANAGVPEDAYEHAAYRATRADGTPSRLQIDLNYVEENHWTFRRLVMEPDIDPAAPDIRKEVFHVGDEEDATMNEESKQMARRVFKSEAARARYVEGRYAEFRPGINVTPAYEREKHLCPSEIWPEDGLTCFAFFDGWHNPSCVLGQISKSNRLIYLDTLRLEGAAIDTLLTTQLGPLLRSPKWKDIKNSSWRIGGDWSMAIPDQGTRTNSAAQRVEEFFRRFVRGFPPSFEKGPKAWHERETAANYWLIQNNAKGAPMIYLSNSNHLLDKGLSGAWHFKVDNSNNRLGTEPVNDSISHVCEAWVNSVYVLLGEVSTKVNKGSVRRQAELMRRRAESYGYGPVRGRQPWEKPKRDGNQDRNLRLQALGRGNDFRR